MTLKEFAGLLNNRDIENSQEAYNPLTKEEREIACRNGFVVVSGYSDDEMEFDGAIYNEVGCFGGGTAYVNEEGTISLHQTPGSFAITAKWYDEVRGLDVFPWSYETNIPHEEFILYENGEPWCIGIVFQLYKKRKIYKSVMEDEILFARVKQDAIIPKRKEGSAGYDVFPCFSENYMVIEPHSTVMIPIGIACALNPKWYFQIESKESAENKGIMKSAGIIDSGNRGEIFVALSNIYSKRIVISKLDREETVSLMEEDHHDAWNKYKGCIIFPYEKAIAQLVLHEIPKMTVHEISYNELLEVTSLGMD